MKKLLVVCLALMLLLGSALALAEAEDKASQTVANIRDGNIIVMKKTYSIDGGTPIPYKGSLVLTGMSTKNIVYVAPGEKVNLIFRELYIQSNVESPVLVGPGADVTITLEAYSALNKTGGGASAALSLSDGAKLHIKGMGEMKATTSASGAAIGSDGYSADVVTVDIASGRIVAEAKGGGAAIGSGRNAGAAHVTISGGDVSAYGSGIHSGAGIGGGINAEWAQVKITGGEITAASDSSRAIGCGENGVAAKIEILGGSTNTYANVSPAMGGWDMYGSSVSVGKKAQLYAEGILAEKVALSSATVALSASSIEAETITLQGKSVLLLDNMSSMTTSLLMGDIAGNGTVTLESPYSDLPYPFLTLDGCSDATGAIKRIKLGETLAHRSLEQYGACIYINVMPADEVLLTTGKETRPMSYDEAVLTINGDPGLKKDGKESQAIITIQKNVTSCKEKLEKSATIVCLGDYAFTDPYAIVHSSANLTVKGISTPGYVVTSGRLTVEGHLECRILQSFDMVLKNASIVANGLRPQKDLTLNGANVLHKTGDFSIAIEGKIKGSGTLTVVKTGIYTVSQGDTLVVCKDKNVPKKILLGSGYDKYLLISTGTSYILQYDGIIVVRKGKKSLGFDKLDEAAQAINDGKLSGAVITLLDSVSAGYVAFDYPVTLKGNNSYVNCTGVVEFRKKAIVEDAYFTKSVVFQDDARLSAVTVYGNIYCNGKHGLTLSGWVGCDGLHAEKLAMDHCLLDVNQLYAKDVAINSGTVCLHGDIPSQDPMEVTWKLAGKCELDFNGKAILEYGGFTLTGSAPLVVDGGTGDKKHGSTLIVSDKGFDAPTLAKLIPGGMNFIKYRFVVVGKSKLIVNDLYGGMG